MRPVLRLLAALLLPAAEAHAQTPVIFPVTVAVTFDRKDIHPVLVEGTADLRSGRPVAASDPVRIASISKLVTALGVMRLVDAGTLDLDRDVSDYLGWPLRHPQFPERPITLRLLLSHRTGLTDGADYIIPLGETLRQRLADPRAWDPAHGPGGQRTEDWFHYTNLNFPVVASVMEAATGERFDRLMQRLVLQPLGLKACYNWSGCDADAADHVVVLYRADGSIARDDLDGRLPECPVVVLPGRPCDLAAYIPGWNGALFSPQGGLRISMMDLARIGQMLARGGEGFLSPASFAALVTPEWRFGGRNGVGENGEPDGFFCTYALALQHTATQGEGCHDDPFGDGISRLGHPGEAYGLRSGLWFDPGTGRGIAFFTTAVPDDAAKGRSAFTAAEEAVIARAHRP
ncbi:serine hydrolase [Novosphingobium fuchskuhlense]|uniref:Serine hydrolase n=1 Tax=Novosphingobium fuchskuhlense TaxID=1117702 RepID=A0A124JWV3_9SPHN|nr:serine hydrolase [Novosphingobium fuchskuhlense]KUR73729.1 serine hydrolase [Novosphingobium fuchskuhlense]